MFRDEYDNLGNKTTGTKPSDAFNNLGSTNFGPPTGLIGDPVNSPTSPGSIISGNSSGQISLYDVRVGPRNITVDNNGSIQSALDSLRETGGVLNLRAGTYVVNNAITVPSSVQIVGENTSTTIIDFNNTAAKFNFTGTDNYTEGLITSITSGVLVTGVISAGTANVLVVGGGGGGGGAADTASAGGGGAGGYKSDTAFTLNYGTYNVTVGAGGAGGASEATNNGTSGGLSRFGSITAFGGGGGGGGAAGAGNNGLSGGSGGGGGTESGTGGSNTSGQGNTGGAGGANGAGSSSGGGGGGSSSVGGDGGVGASNGGFGGGGTDNAISGSTVKYSSGGGGGGSSQGGNGGVAQSGGGNGSNYPGSGSNGTDGQGGGGGGGSGTGGGGDGGDGIVIISYPTGSITATGGTITTSGGNTIHTFTTSGTFTVTPGSTDGWLGNLTADHQFFIGNKWYRIAAITSANTLTLAEGYTGGATLPGASYRASKIIKDVEIKELTFKNSSGTALDFDDCRNIRLEDLEVVDNNKGFTMDNCSEVAISESVVASNTNNGCEFNTCGFLNASSLSTPSNGSTTSKHGVVMNNVRIGSILNCSSNSNGFDGAGDGYNITLVTNFKFQVEASENEGHGVQYISGEESVFEGSIANDNGGEGDANGFTVTTPAQRIRFTNCFAEGNASNSFRINGAGCAVIGCQGGGSFNLEVACVFIGNDSTAPSSDPRNFYINESETQVQSFGNLNENTRTIFKHQVLKNTSGGSLTQGDVVILKAVSTGDEITTTATAGHNLVWGMANETIANNAWGVIQTEGYTTKLKVDGTTDIAIGDLLSTFTTAKRAKKASAGEMSFAIALEAYTTNDSAGVINALLISPRQMG